MAKRVMLAVAGAGKTYHICHDINPEKRNLILAFTNENIKNIQKELINAYGVVPLNTKVMTFDTFKYRCLVRPYETSIFEYYNVPYIVIRTNITTKKPPEQQFVIKGRRVPNRKYVTKDNLHHYVDEKNQYYCATLSELILSVKKSPVGNSLIKRASARINKFFDQVMIDEFQDFREYDYDLITELAKQIDNILLVGDYYQHSVSGMNNSGKPFKKGQKDVGYKEFLEELSKKKFEIDETTLAKSRRCSKDVCAFVTEKLGIKMDSADINEGQVLPLTDIKSVLDNDHIMKLVYNNASKYTFKATNWSYSKGDTVDEACVILSDKCDSILKDTFSASKIPSTTLNMLYVALTRSKGNLYLITSKEFKTLKNNYLKV
jgi:DNA helicase-2/ATP-dependent DNA helicase PcrA